MEYEYVRSSLLQINLIGISFSWPAFILLEYLILLSTGPYIISLKENDRGLSFVIFYSYSTWMISVFSEYS